MLWQTYPEYLDNYSLENAYQSLQGDPPGKIPFMVWLLENPASPCALPGKIDLFGHDCIHLLLKQGFDSSNEAFVVGFTMGNDVRTTYWHLLLFKIMALVFYPAQYRLTWAEIKLFDRGVTLGRQLTRRNLNTWCWSDYYGQTLAEVRSTIGLQI
jgi:hypothetical protein